MEPLLLKPYYVSPVWGGPRIAQARGIAWTSEDNHGESFDVSAHPSTMGVVRTLCAHDARRGHRGPP